MFVLAIVSLLSSAEMNSSGQAAGVDYLVTTSLFENYAINASPTEFSFSSSTLLGRSRLQISINRGRLSIDGKDFGFVNQGDKLIVTANRQVTINGRKIH